VTTQAILDDAPTMAEYLDEESQRHHERLCQLLDMAGLTYTVNPRLVRGLDYYNKTVFEWTTDKLGAQATVCGGGRYDMMVGQFGGKATPASGFAAGLERLILLMQTLNLDAIAAPDLYIVSSDENAFGQAMLEADRIRAEFPGLGVVQHLGGGSFKSQFKRADKSGAAWAMVFGAEEMVSGKVTLKPLRANEEQMTLSREELDVFLGQLEQLTNEY
jgi:histidyl-tRNA synthetase